MGGLLLQARRRTVAPWSSLPVYPVLGLWSSDTVCSDRPDRGLYGLSGPIADTSATTFALIVALWGVGCVGALGLCASGLLRSALEDDADDERGRAHGR
jgi:hypothetical protein